MPKRWWCQYFMTSNCCKRLLNIDQWVKKMKDTNNCLYIMKYVWGTSKTGKLVLFVVEEKDRYWHWVDDTVSNNYRNYEVKF